MFRDSAASARVWITGYFGGDFFLSRSSSAFSPASFLRESSGSDFSTWFLGTLSFSRAASSLRKLLICCVCLRIAAWALS